MLRMIGIALLGAVIGVMLLIGAVNEGERQMQLEREYVQQNY